MSNVTASLPSQTARPGSRRWLRWALAGLAALVVLAGGFVAFTMARMNYVPPNLDYATTRLSEAGHFQATFSSRADPIPVNKLHAWTLHVAAPDGRPIEDAQITVDGDMPQHGHGLPTQPLVTQNLGGGDYLVEGMKFQMGGWWVIDFYITAGGQTDKVSFNLMLPK